MTYGLHILRYEIEKAIFRDDDLPALWNQKIVGACLDYSCSRSRRYLSAGYDWSDGSFGYFPSYLLAPFMTACILKAIQKDLGDLDTVLEKRK